MVGGKNEELQLLHDALATDFAKLNLPAKSWVPPQRGPDGSILCDVLIIGGGMCGVAAAFHLRRAGIHNIRIIDAHPAGREGPWRTFARMETLRSPKHLTGPAAGIPNLTFRAWYEAQFGHDSWHELGYIPREMWADYLSWFACATGAKIENNVRLEQLKPLVNAPATATDHVNANQQSQGTMCWRAQLVVSECPVVSTGQSPSSKADTSCRTEFVYARFVVLATGREGLAVPRIPQVFAPYYGDGISHTGDAPARSAMRGRDVAVIGLGASAFDYAAEALEAGARHVRILGRSPALARINKAKQIVYAGFVHGYPMLPDADKLDILEHIFARGIAPPRGTVQRVMKYPDIELVLSAPVSSVARDERGRFLLETPVAPYQADLIVLGTGYSIDVHAAPCLVDVAQHIKLWRDVLPRRQTAAEFLEFPYLGQGFQFAPKTVEAPPALANLLCFNHAAMLSLGNLANDIPAVSEGADRLARHIAAALFLEDLQRHRLDLESFDEPELLGTEVPGLTSWWPHV